MACVQSAVLVLGGIAFADMLCEGAAADWAAVYLHGTLPRRPLASPGLGFATYALAMLSVRLCGNRLFTRFAAHRLLPLLAAVATLGFAAGLVIDRPVSMLVGFALLGAGLGCVVPMVLSSAGAVATWTPEGGGGGGRLRLGGLRGGAGGHRRDRLKDDTAYRSLPDPRSLRYRRGGHWDGEGFEGVPRCLLTRRRACTYLQLPIANDQATARLAMRTSRLFSAGCPPLTPSYQIGRRLHGGRATCRRSSR